MKHETAVSTLTSYCNPQTFLGGVGFVALLFALLLFRLSQNVNVAQRAREFTCHLEASGQGSARPKLRKKFSALATVRLVGHHHRVQ